MLAKFLKFAARRDQLQRILVLVAFGSLTLLASFLSGRQPAPVNAQGNNITYLISPAGSGASISGSTGSYLPGIANRSGAGFQSSEYNSTLLQTTTQPAGATSPTAAVDRVLPFQLSTPAPDGEIIHVVQEGQFLISIAQAYQISLAELFSLNNLTDQSVIYPGQKLFIKLADRTPEPIVTETSLPTTPPPPTPSPTRRPTRTPRTTAIEASATLLGAAPEPGSATPSANGGLAVNQAEQINKLDPMLVIIGGLVGFGALMILFGTFFRRSR